MVEVIIGGLLAILGGIAGVWIQSRCARKIKMDEIIAEKKVEANNEAYIHMKTIEGMLIQSTLEEVKDKFYEYDKWFFNNRLFLPGTFPDKWLSIKSNIIKAISLKRALPDTADELEALMKSIGKLKDNSIDVIYKEMKLKKMKIEGLSNRGRRAKKVR